LSDILHAPDEVIMAAVLAVLSAACQKLIRVQPPNRDKAHVTTLSLYTSAETSAGKSPVMDKLFSALHAIDLARVEKHKQGQKRRHDDQALLLTKRRVLLSKVAKLYKRGTKADPVELADAEQELRDLDGVDSSYSKSGNMVKGDISLSKLLDELDGTGVSILIATPEGRNFFGKMTDDDLEKHNLLRDGDTVTKERRYHSVTARSPLVTYCAMTHPDEFDGFIKRLGGKARKSGWLGRGLVSKAAPRRGYARRAVLHPTFPKTEILSARVLALLEECEVLDTDSAFQPIILTFDEEATMAFMKMLSENDRLMASDAEWGLIQDFGRKHPSNVARVAAIFHHFGEQPGARISRMTLMYAIRIVDWFMQQANQIFVTEPMLHKVKKLVSFLHDKCFIQEKHWAYADRGQTDLIPLRWIMQFHNIERDELDPLLDFLTQRGSIERHDSRMGKHCIWLNPEMFSTL
jgi:hypothetical protein